MTEPLACAVHAVRRAGISGREVLAAGGIDVAGWRRSPGPGRAPGHHLLPIPRPVADARARVRLEQLLPVPAQRRPPSASRVDGIGVAFECSGSAASDTCLRSVMRGGTDLAVVVVTRGAADHGPVRGPACLAHSCTRGMTSARWALIDDLSARPAAVASRSLRALGRGLQVIEDPTAGAMKVLVDVSWSSRPRPWPPAATMHVLVGRLLLAGLHRSSPALRLAARARGVCPPGASATPQPDVLPARPGRSPGRGQQDTSLTPDMVPLAIFRLDGPLHHLAALRQPELAPPCTAWSLDPTRIFFMARRLRVRDASSSYSSGQIRRRRASAYMTPTNQGLRQGPWDSLPDGVGGSAATPGSARCLSLGSGPRRGNAGMAGLIMSASVSMSAETIGSHVEDERSRPPPSR